MHIVILGNGISGVSCARWIRKLSAHQISIISDESDYFFSRTALMYLYMGHMRLSDIQPYENHFWKKNRIDLHKGYVQNIDFQAQILYFQDGQTLSYDALVLATGSKPNKFGWTGQDLIGVQGLYHLQDLATMEQLSKDLHHAVIVGGGLIGVEMAEMFHSRHIPVTFLVRENSFWNIVLPPEESAMINRHLLEYGIDLRLSTALDSLLDEDADGRVDAIITTSGERISCQFVGLTVGVSPNIDFLRTSPLNLNKGILVDEFLQTNLPNVYAIGDCAELQNPQEGRRSIEAIWYTGRMMGEVAAYNICGKPVVYQPKLWFNSAKFFDIEYQVYGDIRAELPAHQATWYKEHPNGRKSIRINYERSSRVVVGFNLMGVRFRHEVCEQWIIEKRSLDFVLQNLALAYFDPEFYKDIHYFQSQIDGV